MVSRANIPAANYTGIVQTRKVFSRKLVSVAKPIDELLFLPHMAVNTIH